MQEIQNIQLKRCPDPDMTPEHLGSYADVRTSPISIDRLHTIYCPVNATGADEAECTCAGIPSWRTAKDYRYFNPPAGREDDDSIRDQYLRAEEYNCGAWGYLYLRAEARATINGIPVTVDSDGIGGVESDGGEDYLRELEDAQLQDLAAKLAAIGFTAEQIATATAEARR